MLRLDNELRGARNRENFSHVCFTQEDPIGVAGGLNLYGYAGGDPINNSDPFGLCCTDPISTAVAIARAAPAAKAALVATGTAIVQTGTALAAAGEAINNASAAVNSLLEQAPGKLLQSVTNFVVNTAGEAVVIPNGATGPTAPRNGTGMVYQGGSGGPGLSERTTGVRIMDPNRNQGRRVNYQNRMTQTIDPKTGKTIDPTDGRGHVPYQAPPSSP